MLPPIPSEPSGVCLVLDPLVRVEMSVGHFEFGYLPHAAPTLSRTVILLQREIVKTIYKSIERKKKSRFPCSFVVH